MILGRAISIGVLDLALDHPASFRRLAQPAKSDFLIFFLLKILKIINFRFSGPRTNPDEPGAPGGRNGRATAKRCGRNERTTAWRFERTDEPPRSGEADEPQTAVRLHPYSLSSGLLPHGGFPL